VRLKIKFANEGGDVAEDGSLNLSLEAIEEEEEQGGGMLR